MSRKQTVKQGRPNKKADVERKRDERAARRALAKERKNRPGSAVEEEEEFVSFTNQLQVLGLKLREVPGDGNCLFRALGDQLEGHSNNHLKHRRDTVEFMTTHRQDFEPFVEDDVPFERHVSNLAKPGTFAGNDAIVAFARNHQLNVVIHQVNAPLWQIKGSDKPFTQELHIAYRYGEHYDSVRHIGDNSETPANLRTEILSNRGNTRHDKYRDHNLPLSSTANSLERQNEEEEERRHLVETIQNITGCMDTALILQSLEAKCLDIDAAAAAVMQKQESNESTKRDCIPSEVTHTLHLSSPLWKDCGTGSRIFGKMDSQLCETASTQSSDASSSTSKVSSRQRKEQQRLQKKKRQEERHRQKILENKNKADSNCNQNPDGPVTLVRSFATLNI
ncbi:OTU domain-containing protein 3 isoform X1 [Erpetoichthys calabaricus]|uniref:OTU domain-containing protein 3 n=1 Tax=Erpetoichthys calabaricus TaxID=27687 RepID=A0A8C4RXP2_ERPCA|nr:OTU domain-containing protein 3 isoform X1 [Erpetoichthys calabaricus]XP_028663175.1 OTU domain-containing protein 3 isoform X1 [Erpetoichthys calabaricus]